MSVARNISSLARINDTSRLGGNPIQRDAEKTWHNFRESIGTMLEEEESRHEIVMHQDDIRLLHYLPCKDVLYSIPLLTVYAPINRYHIMDIRKGRSVVEHFVQAGFDVFLLDWGPQIHNRPTIDDYLMYIDSSIASIKKSTGAPKVSLLGYSWGGVLSCIYTSLAAGQQNIHNLVLQSAHVDFDKDDSILASWFRKFPASEIRKKFESIDTSFINLALVMRNPAIHLQDASRFSFSMNKTAMNILDVQPIADSLRVLMWLTHTSDMPAKLFSTYLENFYQRNQMINKQLTVSLRRPPLNNVDDKANISTEVVDLQNISVRFLNIVGEFDDICPPAASIPAGNVFSSKDVQTIRFPVGHIELCIGADAHERLWQVVEWLKNHDGQ